MGNKLFERAVNCCSLRHRSENGLNTARAFVHIHSVQVGIHTPDTLLCFRPNTEVWYHMKVLIPWQVLSTQAARVRYGNNRRV